MIVFNSKMIALDGINPFDATHVRIDEPPGFRAVDKVPNEHLLGAVHCVKLLFHGRKVRPIAVCPSHLVPEHLRGTEPWQRIDGFKRYWGHRMIERAFIECVIFDEYILGPQHGMSMEIE